jgi:hypothetical protein
VAFWRPHDAVLEQRLFAHAGVKRGFRRRAEPDWGSLACELKRPGVNLMVLWQEYRAVDPAGHGYSRFCDLFRKFERRLSPTMRQDHPAGDKVFVDYSGKKIIIFDRAQRKPARQVFATLVLSVLPLLVVELPIVGVGPASRLLPTSVHRKNQSSSGQTKEREVDLVKIN